MRFHHFTARVVVAHAEQSGHGQEQTSPRSPVNQFIAVILHCFLMTACGSVSSPPLINAELPLDSAHSDILALMRQAQDSSGSLAVTLYLQAAERFLTEAMFTDAGNALAEITDIDSQSTSQQLQYAILQAKLAMASENYADAEGWLTGTLAAGADNISAAVYYPLLGDVYRQQDQHAQAVRSYAEITASQIFAEDSEVFDHIWQSLQQASDTELQTLAGVAASYELRGWIELQRVLRDSDLSIRSQLDAITQWRRTWSRHSAAARLPQALTLLQAAGNAMPQHLVLILPVQQQSGTSISEGFFSAYYQTLETTSEVPRVTVIDSSAATEVSEMYNQAVAAGADMIIGPLSKALVNQLGQRDSLPVPTLALNYVDSEQQPPTNLYQFGLAPEDEMMQLAELAWQTGHRNVAVLTPDSQDYRRLGNEFSGHWQQRGGQIVSTANFADTTDYSDTIKRLLAIDSSEARAEKILELLPRNSIEFIPRRRQDIDCIFLIANPGQGRQIKPTLSFFFAEDVPVYAMPSIYDGEVNPLNDRDLDGIWFADSPWLLRHSAPLREQVSTNLRVINGPLLRLRALGLDSFRLYARLQLLSEGTISQLPGATGQLTMAEDRSIHRRLHVARFINGEAQEFPDLSANSN
ncbi:MAG: penicillin-binding protein activator [Gammaproteobacteria bacterium]|nr:penicillin-binding protein activator [Gammaproteobacteria bacterium]